MPEFFSLDGVAISRDIANYGYDVDFLVQDVDVGPPES